MIEDNFAFLNLFGEIKEEFIAQSMLPWQGDSKWWSFYQVWKKIAVFVLVAGLSLCCIFHTQVKATVEKFVTMIENLLNNPNELLEYTKVIGKTIEREGIEVQLQAVLLSDEHIMIGVLADAKGKEISIDVASVVINDESVLPISYSSMANDENECVIDWKFTNTLPMNKENIVEIEVHVFCVETQEIIPFAFSFTASNTELMSHTVYQSVNQNMRIYENKAGIETVYIRDIMLNGIHSKITLECQTSLTQDLIYYLVGTDNLGNETYYSISEYEDGVYTFENEFGVSDIDSEWIDVQLYSIDAKYMAELGNNNMTKDDLADTDCSEISDVYSVGKEDMTSISGTLRIVLD